MTYLRILFSFCLLFIPAVNMTNPVFAEIDWRQCARTEIRVLAIEHPFTSYLAERLRSFEKKTGIDVELDVFPEHDFRQTRFQELDEDTNVDAFMLMPGISKLAYWQLGWLMPLDDFINDPELTDSEWDASDFFDSAMQGASVKDQQLGIPINVETSLLAYRKDLFKTFKIAVPKTLTELEAAAGFFHGQNFDGKEMIGLTMRGKGASATSQWVDFLYSFGGRWTNGKGKAQISSPESIAAFRAYGELLRKLGPPDATDFGWKENTALFMEGRAAMIYDSNMFRALYEDPKGSEVAGKVGYTILPDGPAGSHPHVSSWSLSISGKSQEERQKAAWLFIQWATGKQHTIEALLHGIPTARSSAWKSESYRSHDPYPDWSAASLASFTQGQPLWNPPVLQVQKIREIVGQALVKAIQGEKPEELAEEATTLWMKHINHAK